MRKVTKNLLGLMMMLVGFNAYTQTVISGKVTDETKEPVIGANISIKGTTEGTVTDINGDFELSTEQLAPFTVVISMVGMANVEKEISESAFNLNITLKEETNLLNTVVVSASRVEEKILESPVTIEKMDQKMIKQSSSGDYYDDLAKLKGVQTINGSMTATAVNTRGFGGIANTRFVQLMDGMDNAAPLLNFPSGNVVGIGELDIQNVELVPGAASALYGPNAFNGILLMNSKNPFDAPGFSAQMKGGFAQAGNSYGTKPLGSIAMRMAHIWKRKGQDYVAVKFNLNAFQGTDWYADAYTTRRAGSALAGTAGFDGLNLYGDEANILDVNPLALDGLKSGLLDAGINPATVDSLSALMSATQLRRTGIKEADLIDNNKATSYKGDVGVYYRPFKDKSYEFSYNYRVGHGNSIYQGSERYALRGFIQQFHKAEIKGKDFFVRSYMSQTKAGNSYNLGAVGAFANNLGVNNFLWTLNYLTAFGQELGTALASGTSAQEILANPEIYYAMDVPARAAADQPWTSLSPEEQQEVIGQVRNTLFKQDGAKFIDNSRLFHTEGMFDLSKWTHKVIDVQVGGNHRLYSLMTNGTVFNEDPDGDGKFERININEYGAYLQLKRKLFDDVLTLQGSIRYDKNQNFKGVWSPRMAAVLTLGEQRNHNIRMSYQTGFRNPDTQAQYIDFPLPTGHLLGGTKENAEKYNVFNTPIVTQESYLRTQADPSAKLDTVILNYVEPEKLQVVELGYKALVTKKLMLDLNGYFNIYDNFIEQILVRDADNYLWAPATNISNRIYSYGAGIGVSYVLPKNLLVRASYNYMDYKVKDDEGDKIRNQLSFMASSHQFFAGLSGDKVWKGLGFAVDYRWQSAMLFISGFANGTVKARGVLDANVTYSIDKIYTQIKIGAPNIAGPMYVTAVGGPYIGRTFYVGLTFDQGKKWRENAQQREAKGNVAF
jgi:outer membrane receptor protein involved in Fe transport